ncbi:MAG TPA: glycerol-3-phosphate dehydrogenase/oxidase [Gemmatimonadaceae bacterium]|nr:glycerol-3-phosphate dehydrogenase/oxidase [Gemmatimonadaceae bacterium]
MPSPLPLRSFSQLGAAPFDVLVIGGGITGAGIARDAALRGLKTALVERDDFASGTSSRSSRLVHGGVRYLEHGYLHLVFEASRERRTLLSIAPHLVHPLAFTWPVYAGARVPRWKLGAGLLLYDALALFRNVGTHRQLSVAQVLANEPALRSDGLQGGAQYWDAATDDARLTLANALAAAEAGAVVVNHAGVCELVHSGERVVGAIVADAFGSGSTTIRAAVTVNAAGPWSTAIRRMDRPDAPPAVQGTKGVHLAVPAARVGNHGAVTLLSVVDGRVMFVLPFGALTIIGTTDTQTTATPDAVRASRSDIAYLLESANAAFPAAGLGDSDVVSAWAGIRPLSANVREAGTDPASLSREHSIDTSAGGVISISGGKLTTYRSMAAEVVDAVERALGRGVTASATQSLLLPGGALGATADTISAAAARVGSHDIASRLVRAYGDRWPLVWAFAERDRALAQPLVPGLPYIGAEVLYAAEREMACTVSDVLMRRTQIAFETRDAGRAIAPYVAELLAPIRGWDAGARAAAVAQYDADAERVFGVDP